MSRRCTELLKKAILHKGFSVVEILSQCPTHYGRKNKEGDAVSMLELHKTNTAKIGSKGPGRKPQPYSPRHLCRKRATGILCGV